MERPVLIRPATAADLPALTAIYNYYVIHSVVTFDTEVFSVAQRQIWFDGFASSGRYRLLVADRGGEVIGYACSTPLKPKPAYASSVETSVYLLADAEGGGTGSQLYTALFDALKDEDVHRAYAVLALPNDTSRAFHLKFGFEPLHVLHEVGRKFDRYVDTEWFEKKLS